MAANIKLIMSGGAANTNPSASLGGVISSASGAKIETSNVTLNNLFDNITKIENVNQTVNYRCIYIKNEGDELFASASVFIAGSTAADISVGLGAVTSVGAPSPGVTNGIVGLYAASIINEKGTPTVDPEVFDPPLASLSPSGTTAVMWTEPTELSPLLLPDLNPGESIPLWIKRTPNNIIGSGTITDIIGLVVRGVQ